MTTNRPPMASLWKLAAGLWVAVLVVYGSGAMLGMGSSDTATFDEVRVSKLILVDDSGRTVGRLWSDDGATTIAIYSWEDDGLLRTMALMSVDDKGKAQISLGGSSGNDHPTVFLYSTPTRADVKAGDDRNQIVMHSDLAGLTGLELHSDTGRIVTLDKHGELSKSEQ